MLAYNTMKTKINSKSLVGTVIGFFVVLFFAYSYFFVFSKIKFLSGEIGSAKRSINLLNEKRKEFEIAKSNLKNQETNLKILESAFFSESSFVDLLDAFGGLAKKAGVRFKAKGATFPETGEHAQISFELSGNFDSIAKFLILLDNVRFPGLVYKFSLLEGGNSADLLANVDYSLFNFK